MKLLAAAREQTFQENGSGKHRASWIILGSTSLLILLLIALYVSDSSNTMAGLDIDRRNENRVEEIIVGVMQGTIRPSIEIREEFWSMIGGNPSDEQIEDFREQLIGGATTYQNLFYSDALRSIRSGQPVLSEEREEYEEWLIREELVRQSFVNEQHQRIESIAAGDPVHGNDGIPIHFDEDLIMSAMASIDDAMARLKMLFTRP